MGMKLPVVNYFVIGIATVAFIGLSILQIENLTSSINTNRKIFFQKVDLASTLISENFLTDLNYAILLDSTAHQLEVSGNLNDPQMDQKFREIINPALEAYGLDIAYEYAIYTHKECGEGFEFVMGDSGSSLDFELVNCENPDERGHGWVNLTCSMNYEEDYHLALFFPEQDAYVFAQSRGALVMAVLFILLLIGCFAFTLFVIQKQKKISEIKNDFINNLTHEFKTPIASIALATNMLKRVDSDVNRERRSKYLDLIEQESKRLEGHVDKVLQIAMMDSGNFTLDKQLLDIHKVIENVVDSMSLALLKKKGKIELQLNAAKSLVSADPTHMVNIIYNLIDNAIKYTMDTPQISIATVDREQGIQISIRDNGIGIGEEIQKFIFDKFYRAETGDVHNVTGFGLGLSSVKKIIDAHKGKIDLKSKLNHGSEFRLYFPSN